MTAARPSASLRWRVLLALSLAAMLPTVIVGGLAIMRARDAVVREVSRGGLAHIRALGALLDGKLQDAWRTVELGLRASLPEGCTWSEPTGGFFTWLELPEHVDTVAMRAAAIDAGVAYVAGAPFHVDDTGANTLRLSFSYLPEEELAEAVRRLCGVIADTLAAG